MSGSDDYLHGHADSVLRSHEWRTVENSAAYLAPLLTPGMDLLDVGCGPGTLTLGLATRVAPGRVVGVDRDPGVLDRAREHAAAAGDASTVFDVGDVGGLPLPDDCMDVVHAHQVLQHLRDPVAALAELSRVARPGGLVAVRDADYGAMTWYPDSEALQRWRQVYQQVARSLGAEPDAGRRLLAWAKAAGLSDPTATASVWCFATAADRTWWGETWAQRAEHSGFAEQALAAGLASAADLADMAAGWRAWAADPDGWFLVPHGEIVARPSL